MIHKRNSANYSQKDSLRGFISPQKSILSVNLMEFMVIWDNATAIPQILKIKKWQIIVVSVLTCKRNCQAFLCATNCEVNKSNWLEMENPQVPYANMHEFKS